MAPRRFALVLTRDPTAADVFKDDEFVDVGGSFEVGAMRTVKRPSWAPCPGKILSIGTKRALSALRVKDDGSIMDDADPAPTVLNRFQELAKKKRAQELSAREVHLQGIANQLVRSGPSDNINPLTGRSTLRQPKRRAPESLAALREAVKNLQCFKKRPGDVQLCSDHEVYLKGSEILIEENLHPTSPSLLLQGLLGRLVPPEVSSMSGLTRTGERGTVQLPPAIVEAANVAVLNFCRKNNVTVVFNTYNVRRCVKNFLYNRQNKKKAPVENAESDTDEPQPSTSSSPAPVQEEMAMNFALPSSLSITVQAVPVSNTDGMFLAPSAGEDHQLQCL